MIYFVGFIVGILNGVFASGAGQILVFYLIFILKKETHLARALSIAILSISSIFAVLGYSKIIKLDFKIVFLVIIISIISGFIGSKIMKKIPSNFLNLISGILIVGLTLYKMIFGGK